jgi:hypothetical protein
VGSADEFLDEYKADWQVMGDDRWSRGSLRETDQVGVIKGPVERIVFVDMDKHPLASLGVMSTAKGDDWADSPMPAVISG